MRRAICVLLFSAFLLMATFSWAGFTETLPKGVILLECALAQSFLNSTYNNDGEMVPLMDDIDRYEPGGGKQGVLKPNVEAQLQVLIAQLQVGLLDNLSVGVGFPIMLNAKVDPGLEWDEGDYQWNMGRSYTESDFWQWAESMGQPKPEKWEGNKGILSDIVVAARYRFSDHMKWFDRNSLAMALFIFGGIPTGKQADPEELVSTGTTAWELNTQGDLGFHLSVERFFRNKLKNRLTLGLDAYYEIYLRKKFRTPEGKKHPLMLTYRPYVGKYYYVDPGDFMGVQLNADIVAWKGPALKTWLVKKNPSAAKKFPPILSFTLRYTFNYMFQTDYQSKSDIWDWDREKLWRPGYKNILFGKMSLNLLRLGVPLMPYVGYRNQTWIPGKNSRAADVILFGVQLPLKLAAGL